MELMVLMDQRWPPFAIVDESLGNLVCRLYWCELKVLGMDSQQAGLVLMLHQLLLPSLAPTSEVEG